MRLGVNVWVVGKLYDPFNTCHPEQFRDECVCVIVCMFVCYGLMPEISVRSFIQLSAIQIYAFTFYLQYVV